MLKTRARRALPQPQPHPEQRKRRREELSSPDGRKRPRDETTTVETAAVSTVTTNENLEDVPEVPDEVLGTMPIDRTCANCAVLKNETRQLQNKIITLRDLLKSKTLKKTQRKLTEMDTQDEPNAVNDDVRASEDDDSTELERNDRDEQEEEEEEGEDHDSPYETEEDSTTESEDDGEGTNSNHSERISMRGTNLRTEPKHIVFLSILSHIFQFCFVTILFLKAYTSCQEYFHHCAESSSTSYR